MKVQHFFEVQTSTLTYVAHDEQTKVGIVIDPVLNFDPASGHKSEDSCAEVARYFGRRSGIRPPAGPSESQRLLQNRSQRWPRAFVPQIQRLHARELLDELNARCGVGRRAGDQMGLPF